MDIQLYDIANSTVVLLRPYSNNVSYWYNICSELWLTVVGLLLIGVGLGTGVVSFPGVYAVLS